MKSLLKSWVLAAIVTAALASVLTPRAAAQMGSISGTILDVDGKPWAGVVVRVVSDQGAKQEAKTDSAGKFSMPSMRSGIYSVFIVFPPPNDKQAPYETNRRVQGGEDAKVDLNFKDIVATKGAEAQEIVKKNEEAKKGLESLKTHVAAGDQFVAQEKQTKAELQKAPAAEREALKQKLADQSNQAVAEYLGAQKTLIEKDPNAALVWVKLGEAYDNAGRNDEAANAYQQAITLKPDVAGYYNNLGNVLARAGKIDDAKAAYTKSVELDPANAATAWRNLAISLYNANRGGDAIEPLQKSAELEPKNAQTWYLLGACLIYRMTTKKVGDKEEITFAPGTVEAYQKAIELDPNGPYGAEAKKGLEQLQLMAPGIDMKVNAKKKKS